MSGDADRRETFRLRLMQGEKLTGVFVKIPAPQIVEVLGGIGFDFVVIDEEHGPFDKSTTDLALLAARAVGVPALVRVSGISSSHILPVLDGGAVGVLAPHVFSPEIARDVVAACRYRNGSRGFSASTRAGRYGATSRREHVRDSDARIAVIAQIEDLAAIDVVDEIAAVAGIDALFVGRGDLTVAMDLESSEGPEMERIVERIAAAAAKAGKPLCVFAGSAIELRAIEKFGATAVIFSTDQGLLREAGRAALARLRE